MHVKYSITALIPLVPPFLEIQLNAAPLAQGALPGHYVQLSNQVRCYFSAAQNTITLLLSEEMLPEPLSLTQSLWLSERQGTPLSPPTQRMLLLAEEDALPAALFYVRHYRKHFSGLVLLGTKTHFPFRPAPSRYVIPYMPNEVTGALPLLDDWQVPNRLASHLFLPGVFQGDIHTLAHFWLQANTAYYEKKVIASLNPIPLLS